MQRSVVIQHADTIHDILPNYPTVYRVIYYSKNVHVFDRKKIYPTELFPLPKPKPKYQIKQGEKLCKEPGL